MKILSKYKDYYDFLTGVYGVDEKIVLDRRKFDPLFFLHEKRYDHLGDLVNISTVNKPNDAVYSVLVCGKRIDFVYTSKGEFLYGDEIIDRYPAKENLKIAKKYRGSFTNSIGARTEITLDEHDLNLKGNCPIIITQFTVKPWKSMEYECIRFPKLSEIQFNKVMPPKEIYLLLCDWLSPKDVDQKPLSGELPQA